MSESSSYRSKLPQLSGKPFLVDGGIETYLMHHAGIDLPHFAAFPLLESESSLQIIDEYFRRFLEIAQAVEAGFVLESLTWRASRDWGAKLGYSRAALADVNRAAVALCVDRRRQWSHCVAPIVVSGCVGPRHDAYQMGVRMTADDALRYHIEQIGTFAATEVDVITAATLNNPEEGLGIVHAAQECNVPVVLSFTLDANGVLASGQSLAAAIRRIDDQSDGYVSYYGINCVHPSHFEHLFASRDACLSRVRAVRGNASKKSHVELDGANVLDEGDPEEFGEDYLRLTGTANQLNVLGGCCGTDHRHVAALAARCIAQRLES